MNFLTFGRFIVGLGLLVVVGGIFVYVTKPDTSGLHSGWDADIIRTVQKEQRQKGIYVLIGGAITAALGMGILLSAKKD